jgi:hypothetical protein
MPLVLVIGAETADYWESVINAGLAGALVGLAWWAAGRIGVDRLRDRVALVLLLGFSTQVWWVTTRGGVWHTGHLVAVILTLFVIAELFGRRRPWLLGLLIGAAFLTRPPIALVGPVVALWLVTDWEGLLERGRSLAERVRAIPLGRWSWVAVGFAPAVLFSFWYNAARFGSPLESGYYLAELPEFLEQQRAVGLFSLRHVPMNLDYLLWQPPLPIAEPPFFRPSSLGMSIFITTPGLLLAVLAPWRSDRRTWLLLAAAIAALLLSLLYYGGGWFQYGYRYALDSIPFVWALCAMAVVRRGHVPWWGWALILFGVLVGLIGVYWAYNL